MNSHATHFNGSVGVNRSFHTAGRLAWCSLVLWALSADMRADAQMPSLLGVAPGNPQAADTASTGTVQGGLFTRGNETYRVVDAASYLTTANVGATESGNGGITQIGNQACYSCGTACGGNCGGKRGGNRGGYSSRGSRDDFCNNALADPCAPCEPYCYGSLEALSLERDAEGRFTTSPDFLMSEFNHEWTGRLTIGRVPDCVNGCEFSYTGLLQWDRRGSLSDPGAGIGTFLTAGAPLVAADLSAFSNATFQSQDHAAEYWSFEANRTLVGWQMVKLLYGFRYLEYDERFLYFSDNGVDTGLLRSVTDNQMYGLQVGLDLLYPICIRGYTDFRFRLGAYYNDNRTRFRLTNAGTEHVRSFDNDDQLAAMAELGVGFRYELGVLTLRGGFEMMYIDEIATAIDQFDRVITPLTGFQARHDNAFMSGFSVGAELRY